VSIEKKDARALVILGIAAFVFVIVILIMGVGGKGGRGNDVKRAENARNEFQKKLAEYREIAAGIDEIDSKIKQTPPDEELFDALNKIVEDLGLTDKIKKMTPNAAPGADYYSETYVDLDMDPITAEKLMALLTKIEESEAFLQVSKLNVKRRFRKEEKAIDVDLRVSMYAPPKGESE